MIQRITVNQHICATGYGYTSWKGYKRPTRRLLAVDSLSHPGYTRTSKRGDVVPTVRWTSTMIVIHCGGHLLQWLFTATAIYCNGHQVVPYTGKKLHHKPWPHIEAPVTSCRCLPLGWKITVVDRPYSDHLPDCLQETGQLSQGK